MTPSGPQRIQTGSLIVRCVTPFPQFFKDIPAAVSNARLKLAADSPTITMESLPNGFLLNINSFADLQEVSARVWGIDVTSSAGVREYGLWDIEVLQNERNEDLSLLIRSVYLLCEKLVARKKTEACKSKSD